MYSTFLLDLTRQEVEDERAWMLYSASRRKVLCSLGAHNEARVNPKCVDYCESINDSMLSLVTGPINVLTGLPSRPRIIVVGSALGAPNGSGGA